MRESEDTQKLMTVARQTGKSEMMVIPAPSFGPRHRPCVCSPSEFRKLCQIEEKALQSCSLNPLATKGGICISSVNNTSGLKMENWNTYIQFCTTGYVIIVDRILMIP